MKNLQPNPLLSQWASSTNNRIQVDAATRETGIVYKGPIVSNQLNGMAYDIYSSVMYSQFTGGMYSNSLTYNEGQFCTVYWKSNASQQGRFLKCICINKSEEGITATPPIKDASVTTLNGVDTFNGGQLDKANWTFFEEVPFKTTRFSVPFKSKTTNEFSQYTLFTLDDYIYLSDEEFATAPLTKVVEGSFNCFVSKSNAEQVNTYYYSFPLKFKVTYTLAKIANKQSGIIEYQGYLLQPSNIEYSAEIEYGYISSYAQGVLFSPTPPAGKSIRAPWLYYGLPWGLAFGIYVNNGIMSFNVVSCGLDTLIMEGTTNASIAVTKALFTSAFKELWFPVRAYGGSSVIQNVGLAYPRAVGTTPISDATAILKGQLSLSGIQDAITVGDIPVDSDQCFYGSIVKHTINGVTRMSDYLKNLQDQFPRLMSTDTSKPGTVQGDAIRNITGEWISLTNNLITGYYPVGSSTGVFKDTSKTGRVMEWLSDNPKPTKNIIIDVSKQLPTTDTTTGEIRPKSISWDYVLQCF